MIFREYNYLFIEHKYVVSDDLALVLHSCAKEDLEAGKSRSAEKTLGTRMRRKV